MSKQVLNQEYEKRTGGSVSSSDWVMLVALVALLTLPVLTSVLVDSIYWAAAAICFLAVAAFGARSLLSTIRFTLPVDAMIMLLVFALMAMLFFGIYDTSEGKDKLGKLAQVLIVFGVLGSKLLLKEKSADKFWLVLACVSVLVAIITVMTSPMFPGRTNIFSSNPIWLARFAGLGGVVLACYCIAFKSARLSSAKALAIVFVCACAIVLTGSKGPLLALTLAVGIVVLPKLNVKIAIVIVFLFAAIAFIYVSYFAESSEDDGRLSRFTGNSVSTQLTEGARFQLLIDGWDVFIDNPTGVRSGGFSYYSTMLYPHNIVVETAAEHGIQGLLVLGTFLICVLWCGYLLSRELDKPFVTVMLAVFAYEFVNAMFSGDITSPRLLYMCGFATVCLYFMMKRKEKKRSISRNTISRSSGDRRRSTRQRSAKDVAHVRGERESR